MVTKGIALGEYPKARFGDLISVSGLFFCKINRRTGA